jgi:hypothetical protein
MAHTSPQEIAATLIREFGNTQRALDYARKMAAMNFALSADYQMAAFLLEALDAHAQA